MLSGGVGLLEAELLEQRPRHDRVGEHVFRERVRPEPVFPPERDFVGAVPHAQRERVTTGVELDDYPVRVVFELDQPHREAESVIHRLLRMGAFPVDQVGADPLGQDELREHHHISVQLIIFHLFSCVMPRQCGPLKLSQMIGFVNGKMDYSIISHPVFDCFDI